MSRIPLLLALAALPTAAWAACGDGALDDGEVCDDGNPDDGDGCGSDCLVEPGWDCVVTEFILDHTESLPDDGPHTAPDWVLSEDGRTISQSQNSFSTVYASTLPMTGLTVTFTLTVSTSNDDDYIGWAFAFDEGELTADTADWWVFDWKQYDQSYGSWGMAYDGLALSHVTGATSAADLWSHTGSVSEYARAATLGSTGWIDYTTHTIDMAYDTDHIQVWVDGVLEFDLTDTFPQSNFSFYAFSQDHISYTLIEPSAATVCVTLDTDGDGLDDPDEYTHGTDISNPDSDGDGYGDGAEVDDGSDPTDPCDPVACPDTGDTADTDTPGTDTDPPEDSGADDTGDGAADPVTPQQCGCGGSKAFLAFPLLGLWGRRRHRRRAG